MDLAGTQQDADLLLTASAAKQAYPVPGTSAAADDLQGAQGGPLGHVQILPRAVGLTDGKREGSCRRDGY